MNNRGQFNIIALFVTIIIGIVLIVAIVNQQSIMTDKITVTDETIDISVARLADGAINETYPFTVNNNPTGWKITKCPLTSVVYGNVSTSFTLNTDYRFTDSTGVLYLNNTAAVNGTTGGSPNTTYMDYVYCPDGYNTDSGARGIARIIGLFAIIGLLVVIIKGGLEEWA